ncbi:MAG: DNA primase [Acidobacteriota bacterium]|nr:DNA primase [Acidobacteriota bacterium]
MAKTPKAPKPDDAEYLTVEDPTGPQTVRVSHPGKLYFSGTTIVSKLDLVRYFLAVAPGALGGIRDRPIVLKRFVNGASLEGVQPEPFYQKRAPDPASLPAFLRTVTLSFPSGRTAEELVVDTVAGLAWAVNLGCIELHPHPVRSGDLDHPDQLRIDLDPNPGVAFADVRRVALETHALLTELGLPSFPKTSGSRGIHINVPIEPRWSFTEVRRAALALARAVERRIPTLATSSWWKEERHGVFLDYNQNAKDRTTASAYSVRPLPDARVSAPLTWAELPDAEPAEFTVLTMPARFAAQGDPHADVDARRVSLEPLLELAARDESSGLGDAPWPPHFAKQAGEPARVQPSKARAAKSFSDQIGEGFGEKRFRRRATKAATAGPAIPPDHPAGGADEPPHKAPSRRTPRFPLLTIAQSPDRQAAEAGLARWREAHAEASACLAADDILTDRMRGSAQIWYRIRVNLRNVPEDLRPRQSTPDPDDDPTRTWREGRPE